MITGKPGAYKHNTISANDNTLGIGDSNVYIVVLQAGVDIGESKLTDGLLGKIWASSPTVSFGIVNEN